MLRYVIRDADNVALSGGSKYIGSLSMYFQKLRNISNIIN